MFQPDGVFRINSFYTSMALNVIDSMDLYKKNKFLPFKTLAEFNTALSAYKIINGLTMSDTNFTHNTEFHNYETRTKNHIYLPRPFNNHGK